MKKNEEISYDIYHWGPLLFKTTINRKDINALRKLADKSKELWSDSLAGIITDEYKMDSATFTKIISPYLKAYQHAYKKWYGINLRAVETASAWVNYMKAGESNPPHIHHNCHLSSAIVLDVPDKIKKEQKAWKGTGDGPAALNFFIGNPQNFHTNSFGFRPKVGDFFMFPWNLTHSVASFKSDAVRVTVAANFRISDDNIFETKQALDNGKK